MVDAPKRTKRVLRELAARAREEELRRALAPLAEAFKRWERQELGGGELIELIHEFHQGPARDLSLRYNASRPEPAVAYAIAAGILDRTAVPAEVLDHLAGLIEFYEREQPGSWQRRSRLARSGCATTSDLGRSHGASKKSPGWIPHDG